MAASVYPSSQISTLKRFEIPCFAASDIVAGAAVRLTSSGDWSVQMIQTSAEKPIGIARDFAVAGDPVAVFDGGNIVRTNVGGFGAGASFTRQAFIGVIGTSSMVHPQSLVAVTYGALGPLNPGTTGASGAAIFAIGVAYESAAAGDYAAYRVEPTLLSGVLVN